MANPFNRMHCALAIMCGALGACIPGAPPHVPNPELEIVVAATKAIKSEYGGRIRSVTFPEQPDLASQTERALGVRRIVPSGTIESTGDRIRYTYHITGTYLTILGIAATNARANVQFRVHHQERRKALEAEDRVVRLNRERGRWIGRLEPAAGDPSPLPLLVEHNLPQNVTFSPNDSITVEINLRNTSGLPVTLSYGSRAPRLRVHTVGPIRPARPGGKRAPIVFDKPNSWGAVAYRESPSPGAVYTAGLIERVLVPGDSIAFKWRADPLPAGEYGLTVCLELLVAPRPSEGGWQHVNWCAARQPRLLITQQ